MSFWKNNTAILLAKMGKSVMSHFPSAENSALSELKKHWDVVTLAWQNGDLERNHLNAALNIIISELVSKQDDLGIPGPCTEFLLQNHMLKLLYQIAENNHPPEIKKWILRAVSNIVSRIKQQLIAHISICLPLSQLLLIGGSEKEPCLQLLSVIINKLEENPFLVHLFFASGPSVPPSHRFSLIFALESCYFGKWKQRTRDLFVLLAKSTSGNPDVDGFVLEFSGILDILAQELVKDFCSLPEDIEDNNLKMEDFIKTVHTCAQLTQAKESKSFNHELISKIKVKLFSEIFSPRLQEQKSRNTCTVYIREMLLAIEPSPLRDELISFLLSAPLCSLLISRITVGENSDETLSINTIKLFSTLLNLHHRNVIWDLILSHLDLKQISPNPEMASLWKQNISRILDLIVKVPQDDSAYDNTEHSRYWSTLVSLSHRRIREWNFVQTEGKDSKNLSEKSFLTVLMENLSHLLSHSLEYNLFFSGLLNKVSQYPILCLFRFLVEEDQVGGFSLLTILGQISKSIKSECEKHPVLYVKIKEFRDAIQIEGKPSKEKDEEFGQVALVHGAVIFNELCYEIYSILKAVYNTLVASESDF